MNYLYSPSKKSVFSKRKSEQLNTEGKLYIQEDITPVVTNAMDAFFQIFLPREQPPDDLRPLSPDDIPDIVDDEVRDVLLRVLI
jgi:hypothetical protein